MIGLLGYGDKGSVMYLRILLAIDEEVVARHIQPSSPVILLFFCYLICLFVCLFFYFICWPRFGSGICQADVGPGR